MNVLDKVRGFKREREESEKRRSQEEEAAEALRKSGWTVTAPWERPDNWNAGLCYKSTAMRMLGLGQKDFDSLGLEPARTAWTRRGGLTHLYDVERIAFMCDEPSVVALRKARAGGDD